MNPQLRDAFDRTLVPAQAVARWGGDVSSLKPLGASQNFVYRFVDPATGLGRILRITHVSHRSVLDIAAELEFLAYLKAEGCPVAGAIASADQALIHPVGADEGEYAAVVFEEVIGEKRQWSPYFEINRGYLTELGRWLGFLHRKAEKYEPKQTARFHWFEDDLYKEPERYLPESEAGLRSELAELIRWINARPADRTNYGMIHGDLGPANYRLQGDRIVAFDFDDCSYHWFSFDIAVTMLPARRVPPQFRKPALESFLEGYSKEKSLCGDTCREIGWFNRLSAMNRYIFALRQVEGDSADAKALERIEERRREILEPIDWC